MENRISEVYASNDVEISEGVSTGTSDGTHQFIEVILNNSKYINEDSSYDIQNAGTTIALLVFENLKENEIKENMTIDITINQDLAGDNKEFTFNFPINLVKSAYQCVKTIDSTYATLLSQKYSSTYDLLDELTKDTLSSDKFISKLIANDNNYGKINDYNIKGFELLNKENNKAGKDLIVFKTTAYRKDIKQRIRFYFDNDSDKTKVALID